MAAGERRRGCTLVPGARHAHDAAGDGGAGEERRYRGPVPDHRGESGRWPVSAVRLPGGRRPLRRRRRQPCLARPGRGAAAARIRPAPRRAPPQPRRLGEIARRRHHAGGLRRPRGGPRLGRCGRRFRLRTPCRRRRLLGREPSKVREDRQDCGRQGGAGASRLAGRSAHPAPPRPRDAQGVD